MTLDEIRSRLSGLHFAKEALSDHERETLALAEELLRLVDTPKTTGLACAGETWIGSDSSGLFADCNGLGQRGCGWVSEPPSDASGFVHSDRDSAVARLHAEHVAFSAAKAGRQ